MEGRLRVLVVDDDPDFLVSAEVGLRSLGHEVSSAHGGAEAIDKALSREFDVVLLDLMMPRVDGFQVAMTLRRALGARTPKIIVVTAMGMPNKDIALLAKPARILRKPLSPDQLSDSIRTVFKDGN
ncbi:MAG: response regulator [Elusimicrobiota bacterium]